MDELYKNGYADALERVEKLFNQLFIKQKITEKCKACVLIGEIEKMRLLVKDEQTETRDEELGYFLF
jgi:hypothetical protein